MTDQEQSGSPVPAAGRWLSWAAVIAVMLGLTAFYSAVTQDRGGMVYSGRDADRAMIVLQRNRGGHYVAEGEINGQAVVFLVDTGATDVAVSERTARALGLEFGPRTTVMTAAGPSPAWRTRMDRVSVGSLQLENVRATIAPGLGNQALLGMSFLGHFNLRQQGDELVIESTGGTEWE